MTTSTQTSVIRSHQHGYSRIPRNTYKVVVNEEDGNYQEFEVEAASFSEAEAQANSIAYETMTDITYIEVYKIF